MEAAYGLIGVLVGAAITIAFEWWASPKVQQKIRAEERVESALFDALEMMVGEYRTQLAKAQLRAAFAGHYSGDELKRQEATEAIESLFALHRRVQNRLVIGGLDRETINESSKPLWALQMEFWHNEGMLPQHLWDAVENSSTELVRLLEQKLSYREQLAESD